jgi:hypothetical protein
MIDYDKDTIATQRKLGTAIARAMADIAGPPSADDYLRVRNAVKESLAHYFGVAMLLYVDNEQAALYMACKRALEESEDGLTMGCIEDLQSALAEADEEEHGKVQILKGLFSAIIDWE